jgi:hypothetical protein
VVKANSRTQSTMDDGGRGKRRATALVWLPWTCVPKTPLNAGVPWQKTLIMCIAYNNLAELR